MAIDLSEQQNRIEEILKALTEQRTKKDWYTTAEAAQVLSRAEWTVRECVGSLA